MIDKKTVPDRANIQLSNRKTRDRSLVLLIVGSILLMPPVAGISLIDNTFLGIPFPILYVFVVWIVLIVGAALLSGKLLESDTVLSHTEQVDTE